MHKPSLNVVLSSIGSFICAVASLVVGWLLPMSGIELAPAIAQQWLLITILFGSVGIGLLLFGALRKPTSITIVLYSVIPILQKMDERIRNVAKQEAKKIIDFKEYEKVNNIINKDILKVKTPKPTTIKGLKKSANNLESSIAKTLKDEVVSIRSGIEKLEPISSFLDAKGFGLKQQRKKDKKYIRLTSQLQNYRNLPLGIEIDDLIRLHVTCSEVSANMLLATIRAMQVKVKDTNVGFVDVISPQMQIAIEQNENNISETTSKIRARIGECIRELEGKMSNAKQDNTEKEKPTIVKDTKVKLNAKDTEKATGMDISTPTELDNVKIDVTAENVKDATGLNVTAINKEFAFRAKTIVCSCGKILHITTTHGYKPTVTCPSCGREYND